MLSPRAQQLEKLLAADPADTFVLYGLAQEYAKAGDHAAAVGFYDRCLAADPAYCYAYYHKAVALQTLGRIDDARSTLQTGAAAAAKSGDAKAANEMAALLNSI